MTGNEMQPAGGDGPATGPAYRHREGAPLDGRLAAVKSRWRRTLGERLLRALGFLVGLAVLLLAVSLASRTAPAATQFSEPAAANAAILGASADIAADSREAHTPPELTAVAATEIIVKPLPLTHESSCAAAPLPEDADRLLLVVSDNDEARHPQVLALQEALSSYFGLRVQRVAAEDYMPALLEGVRATMVYGNAEFKDEKRIAALVEDTWRQQRPVLWLGPGAYVAEGELDLVLETDPSAFTSAPKGTVIEYNGVQVPAAGVVLGETIRQSTGSPIRVLATVRLPSGKTLPAITARDDLVHVSFDPFNRRLFAGLALSVAFDAFSEILGAHRPDPRVLFRLEDINGHYYGDTDTSFTKTADYLLSQDVFMHLAIIPEWVDPQGDLLADIGNARPVLDLIRNHPDSVSLIQHGFRHFRQDPRNTGLHSGDAFEFFFDDDKKLGPDKARNFTRERLQAGSELLARHAWTPRIFEAPHYTMSPSQQATAQEMYPVIHHPPLSYASKNNHLLLPWYTQRGATVFAPSSAGFVAVANANSVRDILGLLKQSARILPDPVYVVYFHPFMIGYEGREGDLAQLIKGIRDLGYRFASTCEDIARAR